MRLRTIWTLRGMSLRERLNRTKETAAMNVAACLPTQVRYWVVIQEFSRQAPNDRHPLDISAEEILKKMEKTS